MIGPQLPANEYFELNYLTVWR